MPLKGITISSTVSGAKLIAAFGYGALLNGEEMKIYKKGDFEVTGIDFCCKDMAEGLLLRNITTRSWTDHALQFWSGDLHLKHCPYCGAKIEGVQAP